MKNIKYYIGFICVLFIVACEDELDLTPQSQLSTDGFYQTDTDFEQAILGVYSSFRSQFGDIWVYGDIRSDNTIPVISGSITTLPDFDNFSILPDNSSIASKWDDSYNSVARINAILDRIDEADISESVRTRIRGEALFARGLIYFNLVRIFGNVPLVLTEISGTEALEFAQSPPSEVYPQIVADLTEAAGLLPASFSGADVGRATSIAANSLLGRVQLTNGNYAAAETVLRSVTAQEGTNVGLLDSYTDVFDINNEYNEEIIFAIRWANDGVNGNGFNFGFTDINEPNNRGTTDLYNEYETGDVRRDQTLNAVVSATDTLVYKYGVGEAGLGESDWPVLRYSDVLLMLSEAINEQGYVADGEAFDLLNRVRTRAGLAALTSATVPDQAAFRLAMEHERRVELASEGHRWFDLVRTGRYLDVMGSKGFNVEAFNDLFPIPEDEIFKINDPNILGQNPGY